MGSSQMMDWWSCTHLATLVVRNGHWPIPLVVGHPGSEGTVDRDLQIVGAQAVSVGVRTEKCLQRALTERGKSYYLRSSMQVKVREDEASTADTLQVPHNANSALRAHMQKAQREFRALPTVEKRMASGVLFPMCSNTFALQYWSHDALCNADFGLPPNLQINLGLFSNAALLQKSRHPYKKNYSWIKKELL
ncbi:hypothetical protein EK904_012526 [Melospiza melodia maxima]|nr:hypothetical protein EK904_012526 [Melospiza melodia maxima]